MDAEARQELLHALGSCHKIVIISGAGISVNAGSMIAMQRFEWLAEDEQSLISSPQGGRREIPSQAASVNHTRKPRS
jgi:hypothetical protein